jgi:uncharacterized membrane protein
MLNYQFGYKVSYQLIQLAKFLCEVELNWQFFSMEGGYGGKLFFANVCKLVIIILVI